MEYSPAQLLDLVDRLRHLRHLIDEDRVDGDWSIERREQAMSDLLYAEMFFENFAYSLTMTPPVK